MASAVRGTVTPGFADRCAPASTGRSLENYTRKTIAVIAAANCTARGMVEPSAARVRARRKWALLESPWRHGVQGPRCFSRSIPAFQQVHLTGQRRRVLVIAAQCHSVSAGDHVGNPQQRIVTTGHVI